MSTLLVSRRIRDEPGGGAPRHNDAASPGVSRPELEAATRIEPVCRALQYRLDPAKSLVIRTRRMNPDHPTRDSRRLRPWAMAVNVRDVERDQLWLMPPVGAGLVAWRPRPRAWEHLDRDGVVLPRR